MSAILRNWKLLLSAVVVAVALLAVPTAVGTGPNFADWPNSGDSDGDSFDPQVFESDDLTITLKAVDFSATATTVTIEFLNKLGVPPAGYSSVLVKSDSIHALGVIPIRPVSFEGRRMSDPQKITYTITLGPPASGEPITVSLDRVLLMLVGDTETVEGPWDFILAVPRSAAPDSVVLRPHQEASDAGITVTLDEIRFGADEMLVSYSLVAPEGYGGPAGPHVRVFYPDGTWTPGLPVQKGVASQGNLGVTIPPLPEGVTDVELRFGPYLVAVPGSAVTIGLPDPDTRPEAPALLDIDIPIESAAGPLRASEVELLAESFVVRVVPPAGGSSAAPSPDALIRAYDDLGNTYEMRTRGLAFGKDPEGKGYFRKDTIEFAGPLDPSATTLTVEFSEFARLEEGPWDFQVSLSQ